MPPKKAKRTVGPWAAPRILNSNSPVSTRDIHAFLVICISGWAEDYDETEKRAIIDSLPPRYRKYEVDESGRLDCPISVDFVLDDSYVKSAIIRFKTHINEGFYEKGWQTQAKKAMQERRDGKFDIFLQEKIEQDFGGATEGLQNNVSLDSCQIKVESSDGEWGAESTKGNKGKARPRSKGKS